MTRPKRIKTHTTVRSVIRALGGTAQVARWVGVGMPAVSNWIAEGYIPPGLHLQFFLAIERRGERVSPCVFGLDADGRPLRSRRAA